MILLIDMLRSNQINCHKTLHYNELHINDIVSFRFFVNKLFQIFCEINKRYPNNLHFC